jgi:hypothetical protein
MGRTIPLILLDIPFAFACKIDQLTFMLSPPVLTVEDRRKLMEAERAKQDAS